MMNFRRILPLVLVLVGAILWVGCQSDTPTTPTATDNPVTDKGANPGYVETLLEIPAHAHMEMESGCSNNPGPYITLYGELALGGVDGRLIFRNATNGPHEHVEDVEASVVLLPEGDMIRFNKQPPLGGAGGNPWIYVVFCDGDGAAYTDPVLLGRCVQGLFACDVDFFLPALCNADVTVGDCSNSPGPFITIEGEIAFRGLNAKLIFTNNAKFTHVHEEDIVVDVVILPAGDSITFAKQPPLGGVGGNPKIWFQFTDDEGGAMSEEFYLGRCVQLSK